MYEVLPTIVHWIVLPIVISMVLIAAGLHWLEGKGLSVRDNRVIVLAVFMLAVVLRVMWNTLTQS